MPGDLLRFRGYDGNRIPDFVKNGDFALNKDSPSAQGLVKWYPHPQSVNGIVRDYSERSAIHDMGATSATYAIGTSRFNNKVFTFGGAGRVQKDQLVDVTPPFSLATWFNAVDASVTGRMLTIGSNTSRHMGCVIISNKLTALAVNGGNTFVSAPPTLVDDTWYHGVGTFPDDTTRTVYLDGGNSASHSVQRTQAADAFSFGASVDGSQPLTGDMFGICQWNKVLTAGDVHFLYNPSTRWDLYHQPGKVLYFLPLVVTDAVRNIYRPIFRPRRREEG